MKYIIVFIFFLSFLPLDFLFPQVNSVTFSGAFTGTFREKSERWKIKSVSGFGGDIDIKFDLYKNIKVTLSGGYHGLSIDQDNFALFAQYNWKYWKRYFGDINDTAFYRSTQWVQTILKDSNYSGSFNPVQKMDVFPVTLTFSYEMNLFPDFTLRPSLGGGIIFYQKRLYVEENWRKKFPDLDNYVYDYSFRNMTDNVNGYPLAIVAGLEADYKLGDIIQLTGGFKYCGILYAENSSNDNFPMKDMFSIKLGISFMY